MSVETRDEKAGAGEEEAKVGELGLLGGADVGDALVVLGAVHTGEDAVGLGLGDAVGLLLGGGASVDISDVVGDIGDEAEVEEAVVAGVVFVGALSEIFGAQEGGGGEVLHSIVYC